MQGFFSICTSISVKHHIIKLKDKNHMIVTIDAEKVFNKIQCSFMIKKTSSETGQIRNLPQQSKAICGKPTANIILNGKD